MKFKIFYQAMKARVDFITVDTPNRLHAIKHTEDTIEAYIEKNYLQRKTKISDAQYLKLDRLLDRLSKL